VGQTINVMTLGGWRSAVGILVDDAAPWQIENTHRNIAMRKAAGDRRVGRRVRKIAVPTFVATLSICIVFVPVLLLTGTRAISVYGPWPMAVVFAHDGLVFAVQNAGGRP
jgi:multidrug efflux pump subunit AcrB